MTSSRGSDAVKKVLITSTVFLPGFKGGGPVRSLVDVIERLPEDIVALVVTSDRDWGDTEPYEGLSGRIVPYGRHRVLYINPHRPSHLFRALRVIRSQKFQLLYANSFWSPWFTMLPIVALNLGAVRVPRVLLAPRGELNPGALTLKSYKKRGALILWSRLLRRTNPIFEASSLRDQQTIRSTLDWPVRTLTAGARGPDPSSNVTPSRNRPRLVFAGRICRIKNLRTAILALHGVTSELDFDIYGPIEDAQYWNQCLTSARLLPPWVRLTYRGEVPNHCMQRLLSHYDGNLLPTSGENFGHVIAESLSVGCPVITSQNTPWTDVLTVGGGIVVASEESDAWTLAIESIISQTPNLRMAKKRAALKAYRAWRDAQSEPTGVEQALTLDGRR